jgi:hypothetical protein
MQGLMSAQEGRKKRKSYKNETFCDKFLHLGRSETEPKRKKNIYREGEQERKKMKSD